MSYTCHMNSVEERDIDMKQLRWCRMSKDGPSLSSESAYMSRQRREGTHILIS
jgi:hypothetical protein